MLKLVFIKSADPNPDARLPKREMSDAGARELRALGVLFRERGIVPDVILTSPEFAATESARIIDAALSGNGEKIKIEFVLRNDPNAFVEKRLKKQGPRLQTIFCVVRNEQTIRSAAYEVLGRPPVGPDESLTFAQAMVINCGGKRWSEIGTMPCSVEEVLKPRV